MPINTPKAEYGVSASDKQATIGYGLGLQLSEKIIKRHNWSYEISDMPGRYEVTVDFSERL